MALYTFYLGGELGGLLKSTLHPVLMHHPLRLPPLRGPSLVEHQCLPHPYEAVLHIDWLVPSGGLPETGRRCSVGASARRVLLVLVTEEVPLVLLFISNLAFFWLNNIHRSWFIRA